MAGTLASAPCRLAVYLAREAPLGVVLRRGPSAWARLSLWHTDTDTFEHGQWLGGRVYERRCDVSADGALFVYFARKSAGRLPGDPPVDSWAAISRPPWFTALALWAVGGTYCTGGLFPDRRSVFAGGWLDPPDQGRLPPWLTLTGSPPYRDRTANWTQRTVHIGRLLRDGWTQVPDAPVETWQRPHPQRPLTLVMREVDHDFRAFGGPFVVEYAVHDDTGATVIPIGRASWADWDQRGRLAVAQGGRLLCADLPRAPRLDVIADFNPQRPDPAPSPPWASTWPAPPPVRSRSR